MRVFQSDLVHSCDSSGKSDLCQDSGLVSCVMGDAGVNSQDFKDTLLRLAYHDPDVQQLWHECLQEVKSHVSHLDKSQQFAHTLQLLLRHAEQDCALQDRVRHPSSLPLLHRFRVSLVAMCSAVIMSLIFSQPSSETLQSSVCTPSLQQFSCISLRPC
jgi:hypothetical protein